MCVYVSDLDPVTSQWKKAYDEMDAASLFCDHCLKQQLTVIRECGILDPISVPIPENHSVAGYIRAMAGVKELNLNEIMAGCEEEKTSKGKYLAQSYILKSYMNSVVIQSTLTEEWHRDMQRMNAIISTATTPENIKHQAKLCRANLYNSKGQFDEANRDLKSLEKQYANSGSFHVIKSGALFQFALNNKNFCKSLAQCCLFLPNFYEIQFQKMYAEALHMNDSILRASFMVSALKSLVKRFPSKLPPRLLLITLYIDLDINQATNILNQTRKDFPDRLDEFISFYGKLKPSHPICVKYFKRALSANMDDPDSFSGLLTYFSTTSYEYAKAIEVSTKALSLFLKKDDFQEMFEHRQNLLQKIIRQKFWDKL